MFEIFSGVKSEMFLLVNRKVGKRTCVAVFALRDIQPGEEISYDYK